jgi:hypothetical protein
MLDSRADPAVLWSLLLHPRCRRLRRMSLYFETTITQVSYPIHLRHP